MLKSEYLAKLEKIEELHKHIKDFNDIKKDIIDYFDTPENDSVGMIDILSDELTLLMHQNTESNKLDLIETYYDLYLSPKEEEELYSNINDENRDIISKILDIDIENKTINDIKNIIEEYIATDPRIARELYNELCDENEKYKYDDQIKYVNPIPYIDMGKEFEIKLKVKLDDVIDVEQGKLLCAKYLKSTDIETLCKHMAVKIMPVYPD